MDHLFDVDWRAIFVPTVPLLEVFVRGTATYLALFLCMRFVLKRQTGVIGIADLLVVVLIADAAQNAMASEYRSLTEGAVLVATIIFWNYALDWLGYRFPAFQRFVRPAPLALVENGRMLHRNMRKEFITEDELMTQLRKQGVDDVAEVERAFIEGDGSISVMTFEGKEKQAPHGPEDRRLPD
jgi:uncharacterized membrane protein YcaP (DUF421 family)